MSENKMQQVRILGRISGETGLAENYIVDNNHFYLLRIHEGGGASELYTKRIQFAKRVCKLINFFADVSDKFIDELTDMSSNKWALVRAVLTNPLDKIPLFMLIDDLKDAPEYQTQVNCNRSWKELYDKLKEIEGHLETRLINGIGQHWIKPIKQDLAEFLATNSASLIKSNTEVKTIERVPPIVTEEPSMICPRCHNYQPEKRDCIRCNGRGFVDSTTTEDVASFLVDG